MLKLFEYILDGLFWSVWIAWSLKFDFSELSDGQRLAIEVGLWDSWFLASSRGLRKSTIDKNYHLWKGWSTFLFEYIDRSWISLKNFIEKFWSNFDGPFWAKMLSQNYRWAAKSTLNQFRTSNTPQFTFFDWTTFRISKFCVK